MVKVLADDFRSVKDGGMKERKRDKTEGEGEDEGSHLSLSRSLSFFHKHTHALHVFPSLSLTTNLPVNPNDLNDPSTAAAAP